MLQAVAEPALLPDELNWRWNPANFGEVVVEYQTRLHRFIYSLVQDTELANDLVNETFLLAYRNLVQHPRLNAVKDTRQDNFSGWLYTIARNLALGVLRRRKRFSFSSLYKVINVESGEKELDFFFQGGLPDSPHEQVVLRLDLLQALKKIKPARLVPLLLSLEGFSYSEIADQTGLPVDSIKSRIFRVKQDLRRALTA